MIRYGAGIRQYGTHRSLTGQRVPGNPRTGALGLDAIIVPATRPAAYLDHAVTLARAAQCSLVILCSQHLHGEEVKEYLAARSFNDAIVIDLPSGYSHPLFDFGRLHDIKDQLPPECGYLIDLSMKRNVGLVLARMLGWQRVFFLDDDIRDIAYPDLQRTVDMLGSFSAVGMRVTEYPDNSIVCHANRITGGAQDVFVSGAALAVDCDSDIGFFPGIYNEDWFFFSEDAANLKIARVGVSRQRKYDPYKDPQRAVKEEFGDLLAEGLYARLDVHWDIAGVDVGYWADFIEIRKEFLSRVAESLTRHPDSERDNYKGREVRAAQVSIGEAQRQLKGIKPELCQTFIKLWQADLVKWRRYVAKLPRFGSVVSALDYLKLPFEEFNPHSR